MNHRQHDPAHRDACDWNLYAEDRDEAGPELCNCDCLTDTAWRSQRRNADPTPETP